MRESIAESITNTVTDLYKSGLVDVTTMQNIEALCLHDPDEYTPETETNDHPLLDEVIR